MRLVDIDKFISDFPIRLSHYDEENGSKKFVSGIEVVLDSLDCTPTVEAIPIEWLKKKYGWLTMVHEIIADWRNENERRSYY